MTTPKMPEGLPPLPENAVYLGLGGPESWRDFKADGKYFQGWSCFIGGKWGSMTCVTGLSDRMYYAAPIGSEIAKLNGHVDEPKNITPFKYPCPNCGRPVDEISLWKSKYEAAEARVKDLEKCADNLADALEGCCPTEDYQGREKDLIYDSTSRSRMESLAAYNNLKKENIK